ncbi:MAG: 2-C-methyl-D-erythritol 2,4-cyclodiphosphate synthase [Armatimonadetes bacterium]|nr:2-C-methyl-D-erythritol 2,4-cyclodiphosphate synthase [Armatimonadota bacterium]
MQTSTSPSKNPDESNRPVEAPASPPKVCAILLAAGSSTRFGEDKLEQLIGGVPLWLASYQALAASPLIDAIGIVTSAEKVESVQQRAPEAFFVVEGGSSRQASAHAGILAIPQDYEVVLIHDAARPFVSQAITQAVIEGVARTGAAYPGIPVADTIREGTRLLNRSELRAAQTPQGGRRDWFLSAHAQVTEELTDDIALLEAAGFPSEVVPGDPKNRKITLPTDLESTEIRTGLGYDIHRFSTDPDRPLWLGGVEFPDDKPGLEGHSDADSLLHAIVDALLGAACLGDIGVHYPPSDPQWKNCPSLRFLTETSSLLEREGWRILSIDATVVAERPRVMRKQSEIRSAIASACGLPVTSVSVKATTNEGLGSLGRTEGIAAYSVATIRRR